MIKKDETGFTIAEVIVAIALFVIILPTIIGMIISMGFVNKKSKDYAIVNGFAEEKVESLRSVGYTALTDGTTNFTSELPGTLSPPRSATYTISTHSTNVKQVVITITYAVQGQPQTFNYTTYISRSGIGQ